MLLRLYPEYGPEFEQYEHILYERACFIYEKYVERFIHKQIAVTPQEEYQIIRACHGWHIENRKTNKVKLDVVIHFMNQQTPTLLNKIIRNVKNNNKMKDN
jgi:Holliday junction resolvase-like predicted endonuclease